MKELVIAAVLLALFIIGLLVVDMSDEDYRDPPENDDEDPTS